MVQTEKLYRIVPHPGAMTTLARKLRLADYFALAFGTMVGAGWLVLMDDWLGRSGPLGAILGFALGGVLLLPVCYVYGQWVQRLPDAAGEAAYTAQVFPPMVSYFTGWMMLLAYFIVLPRLLLGIGLTVFLAVLNYRGIRWSASFQNWTTGLVLLLFVILLGISVARGTPANFHPAFRTTPFVSILLTLQIVPYFMTGFESVPKVAEEAHPGFRSTGFFRAILMAVLVGAGFYVLAVAAVAYVAPWQGLIGKRFATAIAFEQAMGAQWPVRLIVIMALFGLLQCFNGNFVASSRLLFAYGRRRTIDPRFGMVHDKFLTPSVAILWIAAGTLAGLLLGDALLVPVTEVGSMASALGWFAACLSFWMVEKRASMRIVTGLGMAVSLLLFLMKVLPAVPGHFSPAEWIAFGIWVGLGFVLRARS